VDSPEDGHKQSKRVGYYDHFLAKKMGAFELNVDSATAVIASVKSVI
jgi:hypothetical protein